MPPSQSPASNGSVQSLKRPLGSSSNKGSYLRILQFLVLPSLALLLIGFQFYTGFRTTAYFGSGPGTKLHQIHEWRIQKGINNRGGGASNATKSHAKHGKEKTQEQQLKVVEKDAPTKVLDTSIGVQTDRLDKQVTSTHQPPNTDTSDTSILSLLSKPAHSFPYKYRLQPNTKIIYLLHIHKSAGTALCQLARYNHLSASVSNCNVQRDQRCCGKADTMEAQRYYYDASPHDFVASEGRMYESMDLEHYKYIVVLRRSHERYYSHWKHARRTFFSLPRRLRHEEEEEENAVPAAGGGGGIKQSAVGADALYNNGLLDLERENKEQRKANREEKARQMEEWKREKEQEQPKGRRRLIEENRTTRRRLLKHSEQKAKAIASHSAVKGIPRISSKKAEVLTTSVRHDAHNISNKHTQNLVTGKGGQKPTPHRTSKGRHERPPMMPHPAEDPNLDYHTQFQMPTVGKRFSEWWKKQPDNWNFRQLCGTHCMGIPKYQLTRQDWEYTLERLLKFDTVLFLEDLQSSVTLLAQRMHWNVSSLAALQQFQAEEEQRKQMLQHAKRLVRNATKTGVRGKEPTLEQLQKWYQSEMERTKNPRESYFERHKRGKLAPAEDNLEYQMEDWDPLMAAFDDALYDIAQRWEKLKVREELTIEELANLKDTSLLSGSLAVTFETYLEEGPHRTQCHNECCAVQCSAW